MSLLWLRRTRVAGGGGSINFLINKKSQLTTSLFSHRQPAATAYYMSSSLFPSIIINKANIAYCGGGSGNYYGGTSRSLFSCNSASATVFLSGAQHNYHASMEAASEKILSDDDDNSTSNENRGMDFPGGEITYTSKMNFLPGSSQQRVQCYRVLDEDGHTILSNQTEHVSKELALKVYSGMVTLNTMDKIFYEAQRQGRLSFYLTSFGEEAINLASAAALSFDDVILGQYREPGVLLWRGFTLQQFANQCFGNNAGHGKGRQMPVHYGSKNLNFMTISSPLTTQLPQAVGVAYSLKMDKKDSCVVAYFGDGGASEGDFHAALNFAAVMDAPVVFICRNNGWAISTPVTDQFRGDGIVVRGQGYGISSIRVDGNDALAIYNAVRCAREMAINEQRPILIEAMTYRVSHHSTSDDSTKYRSVDEIEHWKTLHSPITRFRKWVERKGWWSDKEEAELHTNVAKQVKQVIDEAEKGEKPPLREMFTDVYKDLPTNLLEQETLLRETIQKHPQDFPKNVPL